MTGPHPHAARRTWLTSWYGESRPADTAAVLRLLGLRAQVHPRDAFAFTYRSAVAAAAWQASTAAYHGLPSLGVAVTEGAVYGVYDLRPALAGYNVAPTCPHLPDDWRPPARRGGR